MQEVVDKHADLNYFRFDRMSWSNSCPLTLGEWMEHQSFTDKASYLKGLVWEKGNKLGGPVYMKKMPLQLKIAKSRLTGHCLRRVVNYLKATHKHMHLLRIVSVRTHKQNGILTGATEFVYHWDIVSWRRRLHCGCFSMRGDCIVGAFLWKETGIADTVILVLLVIL